MKWHVYFRWWANNCLMSPGSFLIKYEMDPDPKTFTGNGKIVIPYRGSTFLTKESTLGDTQSVLISHVRGVYVVRS